MKRPLKHVLMAIAALAALALGGSALAGAAGSSSGSSTSTTPSAAPPSGRPNGPAFPAGEAPGTAAHEKAEKAVTGADAEKARAAAVASVGGKAGEVTTDFRNTGYEVTVTKSDGSQVEVHLDRSFKVMTPGGPGPGALRLARATARAAPQVAHRPHHPVKPLRLCEAPLASLSQGPAPGTQAPRRGRRALRSTGERACSRLRGRPRRLAHLRARPPRAPAASF